MVAPSAKAALVTASFVPNQQTDFIFSVAGEELGFIGCAVIIAILADIVAPHERPRYLGYMAATFTSASVEAFITGNEASCGP